MAHAIEEFADGTAAFFSARQTPWHRLGTVTPDALTAEDAMTTAYLAGWNVRKEPLSTTVIGPDGVTTLQVPGRYATVRDNPKTNTPDAMGVVGEQYTPVQNEANADFLNALSHESGAHFETAGSLHEGRRVFVTMKMPQGILVGGSDAVDMYLVATNSHDGSTAFTIAVTPVRVVCANTLAAGLGRARSRVSIRHTKNATDRIQQARDTLGLTLAYVDEFDRAANALYEQEMTNRQFTAMVEDLWPEGKDETKVMRTIRERRAGQLGALFTKAPTNDNGRGTRWGAYNAVTEYFDWFAQVRGGDPDERRAIRTADGSTDADKTRVFAALTS